MKKTKRSVITVFGVLLTFLVVTLGPQVQDVSAADKTYRMKIQSLFPRGDLSMELLKDFSESASKHSNGRLDIKVFAEPEIVPGDQLFGATKMGGVDMLQGMGG
ncbi:MAG: hypothetical protein ACN4GW_12670, partial [Desulforhopalus sp.]